MYSSNIPLVETLRPKEWKEVIGQQHILGAQDAPLQRLINKKKATSLVFWGPPGCGKTTIARLYIKSLALPFEQVNPYSIQTSDLRRIIQNTQENPLLYKPTVLWIDEVHRLTRPQQDILLPCLEDGSIILIAATTENPSFQLAPALLSRIQVIILNALNDNDLNHLLQRLEEKGKKIPLTESAQKFLIHYAQGDARILINSMENLLLEEVHFPLDEIQLSAIFQKQNIGFNPQGEGRYQLISALHKSVRGSDCNAALYWLCRLICAGEDLRYIARRMIRMATEDIGLAEPQALSIACTALQAYEILGSPEGDLAIVQAIIYLSLAPKSNALYKSYQSATEDASASSHYPPPRHIINAPNSWMKQAGFGQDYLYDHDQPHAFSGQSFWPDNISPKNYYSPHERGFEREMVKRLNYFQKLRSQYAGNPVEQFHAKDPDQSEKKYFN